MKSTILKKLTVIALLGAALAAPVYAQPGPGGGPGMGQGAGAGYGQGGTPGWSLLSPVERDAQRAAMRSAATVDECKKLQGEHRALIESRAAERGITLPPMPQNMCERIGAGGGRPGSGPGNGPGYGPSNRSGMGGGMGMGAGQRGGGYGPAMGLMSAEELETHRSAMRAAKSVEECQSLQSEFHARMESRAKEKGITLPQAPRNMCERMPGRGGQPGRAAQGSAPGWNLMTPEERDAHRAQMRSLKTYDECKQVQAEHRQLMEARAKEQGVTLPAPRQYGCDRMKARGLIQ